MKRLLILVLVVTAAGVLAPAAHAKGPVTHLSVCGEIGQCVSVPITPASGLGGPLGLDQLLGHRVARVPYPQPFVGLRVSVPGGTMQMYYIPGTDAVYNQGWSQLPRRTGALLDAAANRVTQRRPQMATVTVGEHLSKHTQAYAPLLEPMRPAASPADLGARSYAIIYATTETTPWTSRGTGFATYVPSVHLIQSGSGWWHVPAAMETQLRVDAGLAPLPRPPSAHSGAGISPWWLLGLPVAAVLVAAALLIRRRRGRATPVAVP